MKTDKDKFKFETWETMRDEIDEEAKIQKDNWGFECLKNNTKLVWDIGEKLYFVIGGRVYKGIVCSVNPNSMYYVKPIGRTFKIEHFCISSTRLYRNVYYALKEAEYEQETKKEVK